MTLATLLTATTFKTEPKRQMKRKPDQLQSKLTGGSSNNNFQQNMKISKNQTDASQIHHE